MKSYLYMEFMLLSRFDQNGLLRQTLLRFLPKKLWNLLWQSLENIFLWMFLSEPEKQKIFVTSILFENIFIKKAIVKHLSNFTHFQILSKTSFTTRMFFSHLFWKKRHICNEFIIQASGDVSKPHDVDLGKRLLL